jgi:hypothetical protein
VLSSDEAQEQLNGMDVATVVSLRNRALIAYAFARVSGVVGLKVEDYYPPKKTPVVANARLVCGGLRSPTLNAISPGDLDGMRRNEAL